MRRLAAAAFAFSGGVFAAQYLLPSGAELPASFALLAAGCAAFLLRGHARTRAMLIAVGLALGCGYSHGYAACVQAPAEALAGTERTGVVMTLTDYPVSTAYGAKATVRMELDGRVCKAVYYGGRELLTLAPGNTAAGNVRLSSAAHIRESEVTAFTSRGVFLLAYARNTAQTGRGSAAAPRWWPARLGHAMRKNIAETFDGDTAGFLAAILTGDKTGLSGGAASDLSEAGLYHILAVSGLHCAFLLSMVIFFTGRQRRRLTAAVAAPVLLFYMVLAGCSPSVVRSCVMLLLLLAAPLFRRDGDATTSMAAALALILLQNPFAAASVSLQLSFAAIGGIVWLSMPIYRLLAMEKRSGKVRGAVLMSLSASLGVCALTAPLSAVYFNIFWIVMPLSNLLCLWAAGLIFSMSLLSALAVFISPGLAAAIGFVPGLLVRYILAVSHVLAQLPYHAVYYSNPYLKYWLIFAYALFGLACVLRPRTRRSFALAAMLAAACLAATVRLGELRLTARRLSAAMLDVGQGACMALASGGQYALIDCGSGNSWYDAGGIAADYLSSMGCRRLSYLLLTHYDSDHVSGVEELLTRLDVDTLAAPEPVDDSGLPAKILQAAENRGTAVRYITEKTELPLGTASITVYPPLGEGDGNERGLTFLCTQGDYDLLVTGDMDEKTELALLETCELPDIEALAAGHHGSSTSTSQVLLDALRPEDVLVSVGDNSYGHPSAQTLRRAADSGARVWRTDLQGNITIAVN